MKEDRAAAPPLSLPGIHTAVFVRGKKLEFTQGMVSGDEVGVLSPNTRIFLPNFSNLGAS
ncbi:hypothetical protein ACRRTK_004076 [Alexandromys fortis]